MSSSSGGGSSGGSSGSQNPTIRAADVTHAPSPSPGSSGSNVISLFALVAILSIPGYCIWYFFRLRRRHRMLREAIVPVNYENQPYPQQMMRPYGAGPPPSSGGYYPQATPAYTTAINPNGEVYAIQPLVIAGPNGPNSGTPYYYAEQQNHQSPPVVMAVAYTPGNEPLPSYGNYHGSGVGPGGQLSQSQPPMAFAYPASSTPHHPP